jgi:soluble lytic murein transglycosylase-like protein
MKCLWSFAILVICASNLCYARGKDLESEYYVNAYANHYRIPRALMYAIIPGESGWDAMAISNKGAQGLMQLMPATARRYGVRNPFSKSDNIGGGTRYLRHLLELFHGDMRLVLAAYCTGEDRIGRRGLAYSNPQVVTYVEQVRQRYVQELKLEETALPEENQ